MSEMILSINVLTLLSGMYIMIFLAMYFDEYRGKKIPITYALCLLFTAIVFMLSFYIG